ncbi:MAG TPA: beta-ketoacyl-ACP synthase II [Anaerolineales bacterium]|nr:beta-ketoacyl-ACP synthase II [Anaerolineales bacterium]
MTHRVVITGMGCISPLGNTAAETWSAAVAGRSGIGRITHFDTTGFDTQIAAEVKGFDPVERFGRREARRMDRFSQLALTATDEALKDSGLTITEDNCERIGVYIGTGIGGLNTCSDEVTTLISKGPSRVGPLAVPLMLPDSAAGQVAITYGIRGPNLAIISACATGNNVIGEAFESIRAGRVDAMIAGGAEAAIVPVAFASFNAMTALSKRNGDPTGASRPFDKNRDGFVMGEGAAIVILESETHARARGARILAEIVGYGLSNDAFHISAPREDGAGAVSCMRGALREAGLDVTQIDYLNAHGTSTQLNDKAESIAIKRLFGEHAYEVPISSTKSMTGHLLGAAGAVEAQMCVNVIQDNLLPPTINYETPDPICDLDYVPNIARAKTVNHAMSNSFGFGGHNACLIFARYTPTANGHA